MMTRLFGREYSRRELLDKVGDMSQLAGARRAEMVEGIERGADLIEVFNASGLCFSGAARAGAGYCVGAL